MKRTVFTLMVSALPLLGQFTFTDLPFLASVTSSSQQALTPLLPEMVVWYDANQSNSMASGTAFNYVYDFSGKGNFSTNLESVSGPFLTNDVVNGKSAWTFTPVGSSRAWSTAIGTHPFSNQFKGELFWVVKNDIPDPNNGILARYNPAGTITLHPYHGTATAFTEGFMQPNTSAQYPGWPIPRGTQGFTNWHVYNVRAESNNLQLYFDGNLVGGQERFAPSGALTNILFGTDGTGNYGRFWLAEFLAYTNFVSDASRSNIYCYLSNKYALSMTNWGVTYYPTNFAGLWGWWDANSLNGTVADGAKVATLPDLSGNGRDFTNGASASQPLFHSNVFNGKSVIGFSNQATVMKMICMDRFTNAYLQETFMIVVHRFTNANSALLGNDGSKSGGNYQWRTCDSGNQTLLFNGAATLSGTHIVPTNVLRVSVVAFQTNYPGTVWKGYQWQNLTNCLEYTEGPTGYLFDKIGAVITDAVPAAGELCEIILYSGRFDKDAWVKLFFTYLKPKWGIP